MHCWYIIGSLLSLLFVCTCSNEVILEHVSNITACDRCSVWFTFNVTGLEGCEDNLYSIFIIIYHENITNHFKPTQNLYNLSNTSICNVNLTIKSVFLRYNKFLFRVEIILPTKVYPSNDFRITVQGPPDPVIVTSTLNCAGVLLTWFPPPSLLGCPILYYTITILELNITNITTSTSIYYLLSDIIISNEIYTVTISATNGASTGNETMYYFNTSLVPQIILTHYHIEVDPDNLHNAVVIFRAQVINVYCTPSYPTHLSVNITCEHYSNYSDYNITVTNNGSITINEGVHLVCPLDQLNCSAHFIWSNLNLSNISLIDNFNTYEVQEVNIIPEDTSTGYFIIKCTFLPGSQAKGCVIEVFNKSGDFLFSQNISRLSSTSLYAVDNSSTCLTNNGTYTIYVYIWDKYGRVNKSLEVAQRSLTVIIGCKEAQHNISTSVTMSTTPIPTITVSTTLSSTTSTPIWYYIVGGVGGVIILIVILLLCCCCVLCYRKKRNLIMGDGQVMYNVEGEMVTMSRDLVTNTSGIPIVSGITPSANNTGDSSTATSDYSESRWLLHNEQGVVYQDLQQFSKKRPQAPPPSSDRVEYADILHFPPKTEQHPLSYDDIEPSIPSVTIIPANVQDDDIPPPIPTNVQDDDDIPPPIPANVQDDDIPPPIPANVQDDDIPPPILANVQDDDIPPPIPANVQDDDIPPPIPANVQDDNILPPIPANVQDDDIPPPIPTKINKTSDTTKLMSNDEEITGGLTSPSLTSTNEVEPILTHLGSNYDQSPSSSGKPTADVTELDYQSIFVEGSNNNQSSSEVVPPVTPVSAKVHPTESISDSNVKSEMVPQESQPPKPIKVEDTEGPSQLQIPPNPKRSTIVNDPPDKTNQSVSDEKDPSTI